MRGTKLMAWRLPPLWKSLREKILQVAEGSSVVTQQEKLVLSTDQVLTSIAKDISGGLLETVGVKSSLYIGEMRCSMILELADGTDTESIASAIDAENVEAWCDDQSRVHIAIDPWYSTKDVDQTVLSATKIIHVLLGIHATDSLKPKTFGQKVLSSIVEVMQLQKQVGKERD